VFRKEDCLACTTVSHTEQHSLNQHQHQQKEQHNHLDLCEMV